MQVIQAMMTVLLLAGPFVAAAYAVFRRAGWPQLDPGGRAVFFGLYAAEVMVSAAWLFWLWDRPSVEYLFSLGPVSREFQLVLLVSRERMMWMLSFATLQAVQAYLAYADLWAGRISADSRAERAVHLAGFHLLGGLALLNERPLLSVLFIEAAMLLQHLISLGYDEHENRLDRVSYFKRSMLVLLGILLTAVLGATGLFDAGTLIMAGLLLYVFSLLYYKHPLTAWSRAGWFSVVQLFAFFVVWRVGLLGSWGADAAAASILFGALSATALVMAAVAGDRMANFFWYAVGLVGFQMFSISLASGEDRTLLPMHGLIAVLLIQALASVHGGLTAASSGADLWIGRAAALFAHVLMVCTLPGAAMPRVIAGLSDDMLGLAAIALISFLAGLSFGRLALFSGHGQPTKEAQLNARIAALWTVLLAGASCLLAGGAVGAGENRWNEWMGNGVAPYLMMLQAATVVGILVGQLVERGVINVFPRKGFAGGMDKLMPVIDPVVGRANHVLAQVSGGLIRGVAGGLRYLTEKTSTLWFDMDARIFSEMVWSGGASYTKALSRLIRLTHQGGAREYILYGFMGLALGGALYILVHG